MLPWTLKMSWRLWEEIHKGFVGCWPEGVCSVLPTVDVSYVQNPGLSQKPLLSSVRFPVCSGLWPRVWTASQCLSQWYQLHLDPASHSSTSALSGVCDNQLLYIAVSLEAVDKVHGLWGLKRMLCHSIPGCLHQSWNTPGMWSSFLS